MLDFLPPKPSLFALIAIKAAHTLVWALFAGCILALPVAAWRGDYRVAAWLSVLVAVEVALLVFNGMRCPLTDVAARYTEDRRPNFDIYLPEWLARYNKHIFGPLYVVGLIYFLAYWMGARG